MKAEKIQIEHLYNPIGIDINKPFISWKCSDGKTQSAFKVDAFSNGRLVYSTGKVISKDTYTVLEYDAKSREHVDISVSLWDEDGTVGEESTAFYEMGLLNADDFAAKWINPELESNPEEHKPANYLKRIFYVDKKGKA